MPSLTSFFDHIYLINLERRKDRLETALKNCGQHGIVPERVEAIDGTTFTNFVSHDRRKNEAFRWNSNAAALVKTTLHILEDAMEKKYSSILILEDDIIFHPGLNAMFEKYHTSIPDDWESLYFGTLHIRPYEKISENIARVTGSYCCHCYALRAFVFSFMHQVLQSMDRPLDHYTVQHLQSRGKSYCFVQDLAFQSGSVSDIEMNLHTEKNKK